MLLTKLVVDVYNASIPCTFCWHVLMLSQWQWTKYPHLHTGYSYN